MTDVETLTIITVTTINEDGECESACTYLAANENLDEEIESMKAESLEAFDENTIGTAVRQIVHIDRLPKPKLPSVTIEADLPQTEEPATQVETTIS